MMNALILIMIIVSIILMMLGGMSDLFPGDFVLPISKQHFWADGIYLLVASMFLYVYQHLTVQG